MRLTLIQGWSSTSEIDGRWWGLGANILSTKSLAVADIDFHSGVSNCHDERIVWQEREDEKMAVIKLISLPCCQFFFFRFLFNLPPFLVLFNGEKKILLWLCCFNENDEVSPHGQNWVSEDESETEDLFSLALN